MEVPLCDIFMTGEHVIISKGPHSLRCSREDGSLKPGSGKRVSGAPYLSQTSTLALLVAMAVDAYTPSYCFSSPLAVLGRPWCFWPRSCYPGQPGVRSLPGEVLGSSGQDAVLCRLVGPAYERAACALCVMSVLCVHVCLCLFVCP